jgi:transposase
MAAAAVTFSQWLAQARIPEHTLTPGQRGLLQAAHEFRQRQGTDYYSTRLLSHFLLNTDSGLKVAQVARLLGLSRPTASRQQRSSSREAIQQAHHRMDGRPYGKLLPRYAGPIAGFLLTHPDATRHDTLDFIAATFGVRVSTVALSKFLKKYGLDAATRQAAGPSRAGAPAVAAAPPPAAPAGLIIPPPQLPAVPVGALPPPWPTVHQGQPVPMPAPPFWPHAPSTPAPSC